MFERFTDRARRVVVLAQEEARIDMHNSIGTEDILIALMHEGEGVAAQVLKSLGLTLDGMRQARHEITPPGNETVSGHIPFTPLSKKLLEIAHREALTLGHNYIATEHILLACARMSDAAGCVQLLDSLGVQLEGLRRSVILVLDGEQKMKDASAVVREVPSIIVIRIKGLANPDNPDGLWIGHCDPNLTYDISDEGSDSHMVPYYSLAGDPNAVAVGRFKASFRKWIGVD